MVCSGGHCRHCATCVGGKGHMLQRGERRVGGSGNAQSPVNERIHAQIPLPGGGMTPQAKSHPWLSSAPATCTHATQYGFWAARSNWSRLVASRNTRTVLRHDDTLYSYAPSPNEHRPPWSACMRRKRCCCGIRGFRLSAPSRSRACGSPGVGQKPMQLVSVPAAASRQYTWLRAGMLPPPSWGAHGSSGRSNNTICQNYAGYQDWLPSTYGSRLKCHAAAINPHHHAIGA